MILHHFTTSGLLLHSTVSMHHFFTTLMLHSVERLNCFHTFVLLLCFTPASIPQISVWVSASLHCVHAVLNHNLLVAPQLHHTISGLMHHFIVYLLCCSIQILGNTISSNPGCCYIESCHYTIYFCLHHFITLWLQLHCPCPCKI